jgi:hypothetical protein
MLLRDEVPFASSNTTEPGDAALTSCRSDKCESTISEAFHEPRKTDGEVVRAARFLLSVVVAGLYLTACLLPGFWGRGGFLEGGETCPGWFIVLGFPPLCQMSWPSLVAMYYSAKWLWRGRYRGAFILGCLNILPGAYWLAMEVPGKFELRAGYYFWFAGLVLWAVGAGGIRWLDLATRPRSSKGNAVLDEL